MTAFSQSAFLQALGWAVLNSLWQLAAAWILFQLITTSGWVKKPAARSALASALLIGGFSWFIASFIQLLLTNGHSQPIVPLIYFPQYGQAGFFSWMQQMMPIASMLYLAILIFPLLNFIRNYRYVQTIRRYALKKADVQLRLFVQKLSAQMGIRRKVQLWMSDFVKSPVTIGYLRPVILLPMAAINQLNTAQVEAILLHELAHIRRMDYLLNLIIRVIHTILYFNPFVKAFMRVIERERERSCDELVLQYQYDAHGYASALLTMEKSAAGLAVAAAGGRRNELLARVESLLGISRKPSFSFAKLGGVLVAILCVLGVHSLLVLHKPSDSTANNNPLAMLDAPYNYSDNTRLTPVERVTPSIINTAASIQSIAANEPAKVPAAYTHPAHDTAVPEEEDIAANPFAIQVGTKDNVLTEQEEAQVKEVLGASKRVLEEVQWKAVEKSIADALTNTEKARVKIYYQQMADKANWERMETQLRQSYAQINWNQVQTQLGNALAEIKMDSLNVAYTQALTELNKLQVEMESNKLKAIPDSEVTLEKLNVQRSRLTEALKTLNQAKKQRNIIRL